MNTKMNKVTVFKGTINGREFDTVEAYNSYMNELVSQGATDIQACSSTSIKYVDDNVATSGYVSSCTADQCPGSCCAVSTAASTELPEEDEDLSLYPYMEEDDPFYLDLLVTNDPVLNHEAYSEAQRVLEKCYRHTLSELDDPNADNEDRKSYLDEVNAIINNIKSDIKANDDTLNGIGAKRVKLRKDFEAELEKLEEQEEILAAARKVADMFEAYYSDVANEVMTSIKEHSCSCDKCNGTCGPDCNCDCHNKTNTSEIITSCKEKIPTAVKDLTDLINRIFNGEEIVAYPRHWNTK